MNSSNPFSPLLTPQAFFETLACGEALHLLGEGLGAREPFVLITGDAGVGKSALANQAIARWGERVTAAHLAFPALTGTELLEEILRRFGAEPPQGSSHPALIARLEAVFAEIAGRGQAAIMVVEDAHLLAPDAFEEYRLLANAAQQARRPLEVMLIGLPALELRLEEPALVAIRQRVSVRVQLAPLSAGDTRRFIRHRLAAAGADQANLFTRKLCDEIAAQSGGVPRRINALAAEALRRAHFPQPAQKVALGSAPVPDQAAASDSVPQPPTWPKIEPVEAMAAPASAPPTHHDPNEWVARFLGDKGPVQIGSLATPRATWSPEESAPLDVSSAGPRAAPAPRSPSRSHGVSRRPRPRGANELRLVTSVALAALVVVSATLLGLRASGKARSQATKSEVAAVGSSAASRGIEVTASRANRASSTNSSADAPAATPVEAAPPAAAAKSATASPRERYTIQVSLRTDPQTASDERYRLQELTGIEGWVVPAAGGEAEQFTVVLGMFRSRERAQSAADALISTRTLEQVAVVPMPPRKLRQ